MIYYALTAIFAPLFSALFGGIFAFGKKSNAVGIISSALIFASFVSSCVLLDMVFHTGGIDIYLADFIQIGDLKINYSVKIDQISVVMMVIVGLVSTVVHMYSTGYMAHDEKFNKFFAYLGLFVFSMLVLVMSDNFITLFIGWEGVGLCSWLLIGFWNKSEKNIWCANEAFIMNRIADLALLLGIMTIYVYCGSLKFNEVFVIVPNLPNAVLFMIAGLLFIGAMGKSAQFPFHTWLADAMAGPTPVSALIHAATMVTAGVYLVIRVGAIFSATPQIATFIVYLGAFVAIFAASMALVHNDLKKIIAYSTLSQLGYMFVGAGFGAYWVALFHLFTHAFFKSLLFLGAGNVMHAMDDELNIHKMGALYKYMKFTAILMIIGSVALSGIYPFAGFFSKDKIIEVAFSQNFIIFGVLLLGAIFTAFYSFRLIMLVFFGEAKYNHCPLEVKKFMLISLLPLAFLAIFAGFSEKIFQNFVSQILPKYGEIHGEIWLVFLSLGVVLASVIFTIFAYKKQIFSPNLSQNFVYKILKNEYFIPKFYKIFFIDTYAKISQICALADEKVIDKFVNLIGVWLFGLSKFLNKMQNGDLSTMLRLMVLGFAVLLAFVFLIKV